MRINVLTAVFLTLLAGGAERIYAQFLTVQLDKPYLAARASGIVVDPTGVPIPDAKVTLMNGVWKKALKDVWTDDNGRFKFDGIKSTICYLEISRPGFQIMHVKLKIIRTARTSPRISMELAN